MSGIRLPYCVFTKPTYDTTSDERSADSKVDSFIPVAPPRPDAPTVVDFGSPAYRSTQAAPVGIRFSQARYTMLGRMGNFNTSRQQMLKREFHISELNKCVYAHFSMLKADVLKSIQNTPLSVTDILLDLGGGIGHSVLLVANNDTGEYRFFDPNFGIFKFKTPEDMLDFADRFLINNRNSARLTWPETKAALEVPLNQTMVSLGKANSDGVCMAMTSIVARWFMDHPDFAGQLNSKALGLSEFEPAQEAYEYLLARNEDMAISTYLAAEQIGHDGLSVEHKSELELLVKRSGRTRWSVPTPFYEPDELVTFRYVPCLDAILKGANLPTLYGLDTGKLLSMALKENRPDTVSAIVALETDKTALKSASASALSEAIDEHDTTFVKALLAAGVDPNTRAYDGKTPLFRVALPILSAQALIDSGADVNATDDTGTTALFWKRSLGVVKLLLARGARVDIRDNHGRTPIFYWKDPAAIRLLLAHKASVDVVDVIGKSAKEYNPVIKQVLAEDLAQAQAEWVKRLAAEPYEPPTLSDWFTNRTFPLE